MTENNGSADDLKTGQDGQELDHLNLKEIDPETATPEQVAQLIKYGQTAAGQKDHWKSKAIDPETGKPYKELYTAVKNPSHPNEPQTPTQPKGEATTDDETKQRLARLEQSEEMRRFQYDHNLSPQETETVFAFAKGKGVKPEAALEDTFIKGGLTASRKASNTANAIPGSSPRSPRIENKSFKEMSPKEREKNFGAVVEGLAQK